MGSSTMEFEEHHRWKDMIWFCGSSPALPSNLGMSEGSLVGMGGHAGLCRMGSLVNLARSGRLRLAMYGKLDGGCDTEVGWITLGPMPPSGGVM